MSPPHLDLLVHDPEELGGARGPEDALEVTLWLVLMNKGGHRTER